MSDIRTKRTGDKRADKRAGGSSVKAGAALLLSLALLGLSACSNTESTKSAGKEERASESQEALADAQGRKQTAGASEAADEAAADSAAENSDQTTGEDAGTVADASAASVPFSALFQSFSLSDTDGNPVTEEIFQSSDLTLVNIWATFCGPCLKEMPALAELDAQYREAGKRFQVVGVVADGFTVQDGGKKIERNEAMVEKAKELIEKTGADYTHIVPEGSFAYSLVMSGEAQSVPTSVFVDKDGNIVGRSVIGSRSKENWTAIIDERLAEIEEDEG